MGDDVRIDRSRTFLISVFGAGLVSAGLYLSALLAFAFLLPLQFAFGRLGKGGGFRAAAISALVLTGTQVFFLAGSGTGFTAAWLGSLGFPLLLILTLVVLNHGYATRLGPSVRLVTASLILALVLSPLVSSLLADGSLKAALLDTTKGFTEEIRKGIEAKIDITAPEYDGAALMASLDPERIVDSSLRFFVSAFAGLVFLLIGGSWWIGNRIAGEGSLGRGEAVALRELRLPPELVWPLLASLTLLLATLAIDLGQLPRVVAWNLSIVFALAYAAQGAGIVAHHLERLKVPGFLRIALALTIPLSAISSPIGAGLVAILPVLGVTELWIPYRTKKGVGA